MNTAMTLFLLAGLLSGLLIFISEYAHQLGLLHKTREEVYGFSPVQLGVILLASYLLLGLAMVSLIGLGWLGFSHHLPHLLSYDYFSQETPGTAGSLSLLAVSGFIVTVLLKGCATLVRRSFPNASLT